MKNKSTKKRINSSNNIDKKNNKGKQHKKQYLKGKRRDIKNIYVIIIMNWNNVNHIIN